MGFSKDSAICKSCEHYDTCNNKRMEAYATLDCKNIMQPYAQPLTNPLQEDIAVKHNYRNIKIAENTTVTIDLDEVKKNLKEDFYKQLGLGYFGVNNG